MYKFVMYGPVLVTIGVIGMLGNILSIVIFTRSSMKTSDDLTDALQSDFDAMPEYPLFSAHVVPTSDNL